jgi:hypothetical protein
MSCAAIVGLKHTIAGIPKCTHHQVEQLWVFVGNDEVRALAEASWWG